MEIVREITVHLLVGLTIKFILIGLSLAVGPVGSTGGLDRLHQSLFQRNLSQNVR